MRPIITFLIMMAFVLGSPLNLLSQNAEQLYQKGLMKEEGEGNLQEAIEIYNLIAHDRNAGLAIRAKSLLHVGLCYEKLGKEEATKAYQNLVNKFPSQKNEVAIARERLSRLILAEGKTEEVSLPKWTKINIPTELSWNVTLSPNGKELALVSDKKLWKMPLSGNLGTYIPGTPIQINTNEIEVEWSGLSWSRDGKRIAFNESPSQDEQGNYENNRSSYIVSLKSGTLKKMIQNFRGGPVVNYRLGLSPNGEVLAFSSIEDEKQNIQISSGEAGSQKKITKMQAREPVFSPNGKLIAYVEDKNQGRGQGGLGLWVTQVEGGNPEFIADAGKASSPVWSPDGNMIAFLDYTNGKVIHLISVSENGKPTGKVIQINAPEDIEEVRLLAGWTPDNKIGALLVKKQEFGLYTLPAKGGQSALILNDTYALQPRFSADGKNIFYTVNVEANNQSWQRRGIAVVSAEGGKGTLLPRNINSQISVPLGFQSGNRVSPDGKMIIAAAKLPNDTNFIKNFPNTQIWKIPIDGSTPIKITNPQTSFTDRSPCWSPDGKKVAFVRDQIDEKGMDSFKPTGIYIVNSNGGKENFLNSTSALSLEWSPDGKMIAYLHQVEGVPTNNTLRVINVSSGESKIVGEVPTEYSVHVNIELAWSPDSKQIAFNDKEGKVIKVMSLSDGSIEDINTGLVDVKIHHLDWSPDGKRFVFGGTKGGNPEFWFLEDFMPIEKLAQNTKIDDIVIRKFMDGTGSEFYGAPSPNGKYFSFVDYETYPNDIIIKEIETNKEFRLKNQTNLNLNSDKGTPYNPVWSPDSKQIAYVWENDQDNFYELRIINIGNPTPLGLIRVSYDKGWIKSEDWSPDGKHILVQLTENNQDQLGLVSITEGSFQQFKKIGKAAPFSAKFSPNGKYIAFDNPPNEESTEHDVFVISIDNKKESKITSHPSHDYFLGWSPSGEKILFASDRTGTTDMWSIPFDEGSKQETPELISENIGNIKALGPIAKGSFYYSTPGSRWDIFTVTTDPESGKVIIPPKEVPLPYQGYNRHPVWSPDGKYLAYVSVRRHLRKPNILCIYTKETGDIKEFVFEKDVNRPVWFPDNRSILLFSTDVLDLTSGKITKKIQLNNNEEFEKFAISTSSDGKYIYYETRDKNWDNHAIIQRNLENSEEKELYATSDDNLTMALSPDNKQLALLQWRNGNTRILKLVSIADGSEKVIHTFKQDDFGYIDITWSPDGKYIYFPEKTGSDEKRPNELWRISSPGGEVENLKINMYLFTSLSIHPDGKLITFNSFVGKEKPGGVWVMENSLPN